MKVAVVSLKPKRKIKSIREKLRKKGIVLVKSHPEIVICVGGDGSLLYAEQKFPGTPKVLYKLSEVANKAADTNGELFFNKLLERKYAVHMLDKLEVQGRKLVGMNDIIIRNVQQQEALRFAVAIGKKKTGMLIGDGCVIATSFGATGYFNSITRTTFKKGIGIAFNNIHNQRISPKFIDEEVIKITIMRGTARVSADNNKKTLLLKEKQSIIIRKSKNKAKLIEF